MKYRIHEQGTRLDIGIEDIRGKQEALIKAFQDCQEGRCSCPTTQYKKLKALEIESKEDGLTLRLKPKSGMRFDKSEIEKCLQYTVEQASKGECKDSE
jgi:hypothetical protein